MILKERLNKIFATMQAGATPMSAVVCAYLFVLWAFAATDALKQIDITSQLPEFNPVLIFSAAMYMVLISISLIYSGFILLAYRNSTTSYYPFTVTMSTVIYFWTISLLISIIPSIGFLIGQSNIIASDIAAITYRYNIRLYEPAFLAQLVLFAMYLISWAARVPKNHSNSKITNSKEI